MKPSAVFFIAVDLLIFSGEALPVLCLTLSGIRHVGRDVDQTDNQWMSPRFSNYGSPIAVSDKNARSILLIEDTLRSGDVS